MCKILLLPLALAGCLFLGACASNVQNTSHSFHTVVIDAGHGGHDTGTRSRLGGAEKDATLAVAERLEARLRGAGFHTVMTRDTDVFIPLDTRAGISNAQHNSIFVSIHFNDARRRSAHGIEVHYKSPYARELAERIEGKLDDIGSNRGIHTANFAVLRKNRYPAVLVECGFLSNPSEAKRCANGGYRDQLAEKIAEALIEQRYGPGSKREAELIAGR